MRKETLSRRDLEAAGLPIGDMTRPKLGGGYCCHGGGGGSSSSNATTTTSTDKRMVVDQGIGISSDSSSVVVNALDGDIVKHALDTVKASDAIAGEGFGKLLDLTGKVFDVGSGVIKAGQQMTADAYQTATAEKSGSIDNKTIMILGIAGAAAWAFSKAGGK